MTYLLEVIKLPRWWAYFTINAILLVIMIGVPVWTTMELFAYFDTIYNTPQWGFFHNALAAFWMFIIVLWIIAFRVFVDYAISDLAHRLVDFLFPKGE